MSSDVKNLFTFALDFYRAPLQHQKQLTNYSPDSELFTHLLEVISRSSDLTELTDVAAELNKSPDNLLNAALFLVRQLLFSENVDHYRVLGLSPSASQDDIKKRYRLLIGLFHPDRNPEGEEWSNLYAPDLNEAYNTLKKPEKRRRYNQAIQTKKTTPQSATPKHARATPPRARRRQVSPKAYKPSPFEWIYRITFLQKHPYIAIWGSALIVFAIVLTLNMRSPKHSFEVKSVEKTESYTSVNQSDLSNLNDASEALQFALQRSAPGLGGGLVNGPNLERHKTESEKADVKPTEVTVTVVEPPSVPGSQALAAEIEDINLATEIEKTEDIALSIENKKADAKPVVTNVAAVKLPTVRTIQTSAKEVEEPTVVAAIKSPQATSFQAPVSEAEYTSPTPTTTKPEVKPVAAPTSAVAGASSANRFKLTAMQILISHYITAYDSGDLRQMASLFTENVKTDGGTGIALIKRDYSSLFNQTYKRGIMIRNVQYDKNNLDTGRIHFEAEVQILAGRFSGWKYFAGGMNFDVVEEGDGLRISGLTHTIEPVSRPVAASTNEVFE